MLLLPLPLHAPLPQPRAPEAAVLYVEPVPPVYAPTTSDDKTPWKPE